MVDHIQRRSDRYGANETNIEPAWVDEAFADPVAIEYSPDPKSESGKSDRLIGYSPTARMVIVVCYLRDSLHATTAWKAKKKDASRYWEEQEEEADDA